MGTATRSPITLLDACALLSLFATGRMQEIVRAVSGPVAVVDTVAVEALFVRKTTEGVWEEVPVDLTPLNRGGVLSTLHAETEDELLTFIDLAVDLDDGEAMTGALAIHRGCAVVTDDRKAERILAGRVPLRSTLDLIKSWADGEGLPDATLRPLLLAIDERGYTPPRSHPLRAWWERNMSGG